MHGDADRRAPPSPPCGYPFFSLPPKPLSLQNRHLAPHFSACLGLEKQQRERLLSGLLATTTALLIKGELGKPEQGMDARGPWGEHGADAEQ